MTPDPIAVYRIVLDGVLGTLGVTLLAAVGWYLKCLRSDLREFKAGFDEKLDQVKKELSDYKIEVAEKYVTENDFLRNISASEKRIEKFFELILREIRKYNCGEETPGEL